ncbi:nucleoside-triphosphatase [Pleomorphochaeta sp. DL1XJH-081]|uniref:nucleoside-triphosphatase n=1 Tax=Pleomorphochaeta sp. DL1XJH-081 TaxID=3409690 RepID=UPI003BB5A8FC
MSHPKHIIITGPTNSGKTTMLYALCSRLDSAGYAIGGVVQVLPLPNQEKREWILSDQGTGEVRLLLSMEEHSDWKKFGRFWYDPQTFVWAENQIIQFMATSDYIIFDEIGPIEMQGTGFHEIYKKVLKSFHGTVISVIRDNLLDQVCDTYRVKRDKALILSVDAPREEELGKVIH